MKTIRIQVNRFICPKMTAHNPEEMNRIDRLEEVYDAIAL